VEPLIHRISAWDGLQLHIREWSGDLSKPPILCLPGLVRTGGDFDQLVTHLPGHHRVIAIDYAGRGDSDTARNVSRYAPEACARDVIDICAALHVHGALLIGTSFGGLLAMGLASIAPSLISGVILNDIGPDVAPQGRGFVKDFVACDPALPSRDACVRHLQRVLPPLSLETDAAWQRMVSLTYRQGDDGLFHPLWDIRIAQTLDAPPPDLWPLWRSLAQVPVMLVWGQASTLLLAGTVERMRQDRPDLVVVSLPGIGHAPSLTEPDALRAIQGFVGTWAETRRGH